MELYKHNLDSYNRIVDAFNTGNRFASILCATGTGKSYQASKLVMDNLDKKILYVVPNNSIKKHVKDILNKENVNLNNFNIVTYQYLAQNENMPSELDYIIFDEFHHLSAPVWGEKCKLLVDMNPNAKVLGMSAYSVSYRSTKYERDLLGKGEMFENSLVTDYSLAQAIVDGVLPVPNYISTYVDVLRDFEYIKKHEDKLSPRDKEVIDKAILKLQRVLLNSNGTCDLLNKVLLRDGKYIYFCPPGKTLDEDNNEIKLLDIHETILKEYLDKCNIKDYHLYKTSSYMDDGGKSNQDKFYYDKDNSFRIMVNVNQYGEGVHAPEVNGVILARTSKSEIYIMEAIGRALNVTNICNDLKKYSINELIDKVKKSNVQFDLSILDGLSDEDKKDMIIYKVFSPQIIDLSGNIEYIEKLENEIKDLVKEKYEKHEPVSSILLDIYNGNLSIYSVINKDLVTIINKLKSRLKIDKTKEFIDIINIDGDNVVKNLFTSNATFEDGTLIYNYYHKHKKIILDMIKDNSEYKLASNNLEYYIYSNCVDNYIDEFIKFLLDDNIIVLGNNNQNNIVFSNGQTTKSFWNHNKNKILNRVNNLDSDKKDKCLFIIDSFTKYGVIYRYLDEFIMMIDDGDYSVFSSKQDKKFSDGKSVNQFWHTNFDKIQKRSIDLYNNGTCLKAMDVINSYMEYGPIIFKIDAYIDRLNNNEYDILRRKEGYDYKFEDGTSMEFFYKSHKDDLLKRSRELGKLRSIFILENYKKYNGLIFILYDEFINRIGKGEVDIFKSTNNKEFDSNNQKVAAFWNANKKNIVERLFVYYKDDASKDNARKTLLDYFGVKQSKKLFEKLELQDELEQYTKYKTMLADKNNVSKKGKE